MLRLCGGALAQHTVTADGLTCEGRQTTAYLPTWALWTTFALFILHQLTTCYVGDPPIGKGPKQECFKIRDP